MSAENNSPREQVITPPAEDGAKDGWMPTPIELGRIAWAVRSHRREITWVVMGVSVATCVGLSAIAGWKATDGRLDRLAWGFLPVCVLAHLLAYLGYLSAHHEVFNRNSAHPIAWRRSAQIVAVGFGAWLVGGGFQVDRTAHLQVGLSTDDAAAGVVVLGALELMVITPAAWLCALELIHTRGLQSSVTIPWVICVPLGLALALAVIAQQYRRARRSDDHRPHWLATLGAGLVATLGLLGDRRRGPEAIGGIALYWAADMLALWAALRFAATSLDLTRLILGYATAYVLTRRTLPFAGALILELFLAVALTWVGVPLASAALAVLVYRLSDFCLTLAGALAVSSVLDRSITFLRKNEPTPSSAREKEPASAR